MNLTFSKLYICSILSSRNSNLTTKMRRSLPKTPFSQMYWVVTPFLVIVSTFLSFVPLLLLLLLQLLLLLPLLPPVTPASLSSCFCTSDIPSEISKCPPSSQPQPDTPTPLNQIRSHLCSFLLHSSVFLPSTVFST